MLCVFAISVVQVGLRNSSYTVRENDGFLTACAELATPVDRKVSITISTISREGILNGTFMLGCIHRACCTGLYTENMPSSNLTKGASSRRCTLDLMQCCNETAGGY